MGNLNLLQQTKAALRTTVQSGEMVDQIRSLIIAGIADLSFTAGVDVGGVTSPDVQIDEDNLQDVLVAQAIKTYVQLHFGEPDDPIRLQGAYDAQKAMLKTAFRSEETLNG